MGYIQNNLRDMDYWEPSLSMASNLDLISQKLNKLIDVYGWIFEYTCSFLSAKSDSDVMLCLQSYQGLRIKLPLVYYSYPQGRIIDHLCINHIRRIGLIHM